MRVLYNELALLDTVTLQDLSSLYKHRILEFDEKFAINVPYKFFKLWVKGKNIDLNQRYIEKEKRESLLARYLIAHISNVYKEQDIVEVMGLIVNRFHSENIAFADGLKIIHKIVQINNPSLLRSMLRIGFNINLLTERGDKFLPRRLELTRNDRFAAACHARKMGPPGRGPRVP